MDNNSIAMESLKKEGAVRVYSGMIVVSPQCEQEEELNVLELVPKFNGCYAIKISTVCFVSDNEVFAIPYTRRTVDTLCSAGFREALFEVPFSKGEYPKEEQSKWRALCTEARQTRLEEVLDERVSFSFCQWRPLLI